MDKLVNLLTINANDYREVSFNDKIRSRELIFIIANITKEQILCFYLPEIVKLKRLGIEIEGIKFSGIFTDNLIGWQSYNEQYGILSPLAHTFSDELRLLEIVDDYSPARIIGDITFYKNGICIMGVGQSMYLDKGGIKVSWQKQFYSEETLNHDDLYSVVHSVPLLESLRISNNNSKDTNHILDFKGIDIKGLVSLEKAFEGGSKYKYIGLGNIYLDALVSVKDMIAGCYSLVVLDFSFAKSDITKNTQANLASSFDLGTSFLIRDEGSPIVFIYLNEATKRFNDLIVKQNLSDEIGILPRVFSRKDSDLNERIKLDLAKERMLKGELKKCYFVQIKEG